MHRPAIIEASSSEALSRERMEPLELVTSFAFVFAVKTLEYEATTSSDDMKSESSLFFLVSSIYLDF